MTSHFEIPEQPVVDSTGIYFNPMLRHLDRGSQEVDNGHYLNYEYVFGATAAAAFGCLRCKLRCLRSGFSASATQRSESTSCAEPFRTSSSRADPAGDWGYSPRTTTVTTGLTPAS